MARPTRAPTQLLSSSRARSKAALALASFPSFKKPANKAGFIKGFQNIVNKRLRV